MHELCAAALWVHSPNYTPPAVRQLPNAARNTLCRLLGIPLAPSGTSIQSDRITHAIDGLLTAAMRNGTAARQAAAASLTAGTATTWVVTIDLFAAQSNAFLARFVSWTDEPNSDVVDAFTMRSWNQSRCPCGKDHRETSFIFPRRGLERTVGKYHFFSENFGFFEIF
jgi:hypothetical protein